MKLSKSNIKRKLWRDHAAETLRRIRKDPHAVIHDLLNDWRRGIPELQKIKCPIIGVYCCGDNYYLQRELHGAGVDVKTEGDGLALEHYATGGVLTLEQSRKAYKELAKMREQRRGTIYLDPLSRITVVPGEWRISYSEQCERLKSMMDSGYGGDQ